MSVTALGGVVPGLNPVYSPQGEVEEKPIKTVVLSNEESGDILVLSHIKTKSKEPSTSETDTLLKQVVKTFEKIGYVLTKTSNPIHEAGGGSN